MWQEWSLRWASRPLNQAQISQITLNDQPCYKGRPENCIWNCRRGSIFRKNEQYEQETSTFHQFSAVPVGNGSSENFLKNRSTVTRSNVTSLSDWGNRQLLKLRKELFLIYDRSGKPNKNVWCRTWLDIAWDAYECSKPRSMEPWLDFTFMV